MKGKALIPIREGEVRKYSTLEMFKQLIYITFNMRRITYEKSINYWYHRSGWQLFS